MLSNGYLNRDTVSRGSWMKVYEFIFLATLSEEHKWVDAESNSWQVLSASCIVRRNGQPFDNWHPVVREEEHGRRARRHFECNEMQVDANLRCCTRERVQSSF